MIVIVPSRARPERAAVMADSAYQTAESPDTVDVAIVIDDTDPRLDDYREVFADAPGRLMCLEGRHRFTAALNAAAFSPSALGQGILGAFGDDVIFRTRRWDTITRRYLRYPGIAYANDLVHGRRHPTAVFMSRKVVDALGWLGLPVTQHHWADDAWRAVGIESGCLRYMSRVTIEHMHPAVDKAEWDDTYRGSTVDGRAGADKAAFEAWRDDGLAEAVERVRAVVP